MIGFEAGVSQGGNSGFTETLGEPYNVFKGSKTQMEQWPGIDVNDASMKDPESARAKEGEGTEALLPGLWSQIICPPVPPPPSSLGLLE